MLIGPNNTALARTTPAAARLDTADTPTEEACRHSVFTLYSFINDPADFLSSARQYRTSDRTCLGVYRKIAIPIAAESQAVRLQAANSPRVDDGRITIRIAI